MQNLFRGKIVGIGVAGALAGHYANAASGADSLRGRLQYDSSRVSDVEVRYSK